MCVGGWNTQLCSGITAGRLQGPHKVAKTIKGWTQLVDMKTEAQKDSNWCQHIGPEKTGHSSEKSSRDRLLKIIDEKNNKGKQWNTKISSLSL